MDKITKIFLPTDFSESSINAMQFAIWFADKYKATIDVWHFVAPIVASTEIPVIAGELTMKKVAAAKEVLKSFIQNGLDKSNSDHKLENKPSIKSHVEVGGAARLISEMAEKSQSDLIIMGTQGEHNAIERLFGSVTTATINKCNGNILVVPDNVTKKGINSICYATDLKDSDPYHIWTAAKLLDSFNPKVRVIHIDEGSEKDELNMNDLMTFFKDKAPGMTISFHNAKGKNIDELLGKFVKDQNIDLMIMVKPKRNFFERIFHDSVTKRIALHTSVPLLIFK